MTVRSFFKSVTVAAVMAVTSFMAGSAVADDVDQFAVALRGYDAVAYQTEQKAVEGNSLHSAEYKGLMYLFSSEDHANMFVKNPEKYAPAFNGYCAMGAALGKKLPSDPRAFSVVDGKLYMNLNDAVRQDWRKDIQGNIKAGNKNWVELQKVNAKH